MGAVVSAHFNNRLHLFINKMKLVGVLISAVLVVTVRANFGPLRAVLYSDWITCDHKKDQDLRVNDVQVFFYDFQNNMNFTDTIDRAADTITRAYSLDVTRRLILFVPGYKSHISRKTEELIRQTFSDVPNVYLIIIDHSAYTNARGGKLKSYETSVQYTYHVGKVVGKFLADLKRKSLMPSKNIHCIGHSLGAQMLSHVGEYYTNATSEKVWRVTGIDPAGPCFSNSFINDQIRSGVGEYVEVYHCNAGGLGTTSVLADIDFFINGDGSSQPQCGTGVLGFGESDAAKCSHKACVRYWAMTVNNPGFLAWRCDGYKDFKQGRCAGNEVTIAGYNNPGNATGVFYLSTGGRS